MGDNNNTLMNFIDTTRYSPGKSLEEIIDFKRASRYLQDISYILNNLTKYPWDYEELALNESITIDDVKELSNNRIEVPFGQYGLSLNPSMLPYILDNPDSDLIHWGLGGVSSIPTLSLDTIDKYPDRFYYGIGGLSSNVNITPEYVLNHPDKQWVFDSRYGLNFPDPRDN